MSEWFVGFSVTRMTGGWRLPNGTLAEEEIDVVWSKTNNDSLEELKEDIEQLKVELADRKAALPAHSVRPHQLLVIEELEEEISMKQEVLHNLETAKK